MKKHRDFGPWDVARHLRLERMGNGNPTVDDFLIALHRPILFQRRLACHLTIYAAAITCVTRSVAPGSAAAAIVAGLPIIILTGLRNHAQWMWLYTAFCLWRDPPSAKVTRMAMRLAAWGFAADVGPMFFFLLLFRQAGLVPDPWR